jgi:hypothetical protein
VRAGFACTPLHLAEQVSEPSLDPGRKTCGLGERTGRLEARCGLCRPPPSGPDHAQQLEFRTVFDAERDRRFGGS